MGKWNKMENHEWLKRQGFEDLQPQRSNIDGERYKVGKIEEYARDEENDEAKAGVEDEDEIKKVVEPLLKR